MWPWSEIAQLREQVRAAECRACAAEASLQAERALSDERRGNWESALAERARAIDGAEAERKEHRQSERHLVSMWLRHQKSFPLPQTAEEKAETKAGVEEAGKRSTELTEIQKAMRDANRLEAARYGESQEQADETFMRNLAMLSPE